MINSTIISCVAVNNEFNIIGINRKDINVQDTHINEIQEDKEDREDDIGKGYQAIDNEKQGDYFSEGIYRYIIGKK